jgi:hypothetical protein
LNIAAKVTDNGKIGRYLVCKRLHIKEPIRNIASVFAGIAVGFLAFLCLGLFFMMIGWFGWTDGGSPEELRTLENRSGLSLLMMTIAGSLIAGFMTVLIAVSDKLLYATVTGIIIVLLWFASFNFSFDDLEKEGLVSMILTLPCSIFGGWLRLQKKTKPEH